MITSFIQAYQSKLANHLWCLYKRYVTLFHYSANVASAKKRSMVKAKVKYSNSAPQTITMQALLEVIKSTTLAAGVGPDSWALLNLLNAYCSFLTKKPKC